MKKASMYFKDIDIDMQHRYLNDTYFKTEVAAMSMFLDIGQGMEIFFQNVTLI